MKRTISMWLLAGTAFAAPPQVAELTFDTRWKTPTVALTNLPAWIAGVEQNGGEFTDQPASWYADAALPLGVGRLAVRLDRQALQEDLALSVLYAEDTHADFAVQLFDADDRVVLLDVFGNLMAVGREAKTDTFIVPLRRHPSATQIVIRRISGNVRVFGAALYPVVTQAEADLETLDQLARLLRDPLSPENALVRGINKIAANADKPVTWAPPETLRQPADSAGAAAAASKGAVGFRWAGLDWEALPWARDCFWAGVRGGHFALLENELVLPSWYMRTVRDFSGDRTVEMELKFESRPGYADCVWIDAWPVGQPPDLEPRQLLSFLVGYLPDGTHHWVILQRHQRWPLTETTHFRQPLPHFASNSWHRLRLRFSAGGTRVGLDDQVVEVAAAKLPYPRYQITLRGWQPQHHWHIRNLSVH